MMRAAAGRAGCFLGAAAGWLRQDERTRRTISTASLLCPPPHLLRSPPAPRFRDFSPFVCRRLSACRRSRCRANLSWDLRPRRGEGLKTWNHRADIASCRLTAFSSAERRELVRPEISALRVGMQMKTTEAEGAVPGWMKLLGGGTSAEVPRLWESANGLWLLIREATRSSRLFPYRKQDG